MVTLLPSTATRPITVTPADVATSLTISAFSSVKKDETFLVTGTLTRDDTKEGVEGASISLSYNGTGLGSATTHVDGDYIIAISIGAEGTFTLKANFAGGSGYAASEAKRGLSVGVPAPLTAIVSIVLPIAVGLIVAKRL